MLLGETGQQIVPTWHMTITTKVIRGGLAAVGEALQINWMPETVNPATLLMNNYVG